MILEDQQLMDKIDKVTIIGLQGQKVTKKEVEMVEATGKVQLVYLDRDIKRYKLTEDVNFKSKAA